MQGAGSLWWPLELLWERERETSPPQVLASGHERRRAPGYLAHRTGANLSVSSLSVAAGELDRFRSRRRHARHHRAARRASAVAAARPVRGHRQPSGRRRQSRPAGGRARAGRRLHAADGRHPARHQRDALREEHYHRHARHRSGREHQQRFVRPAGEPGVRGQDGRPSSSPTPRPIPARSTWARAGPET